MVDVPNESYIGAVCTEVNSPQCKITTLIQMLIILDPEPPCQLRLQGPSSHEEVEFNSVTPLANYRAYPIPNTGHGKCDYTI